MHFFLFILIGQDYPIDHWLETINCAFASWKLALKHLVRTQHAKLMCKMNILYLAAIQNKKNNILNVSNVGLSVLYVLEALCTGHLIMRMCCKKPLTVLTFYLQHSRNHICKLQGLRICLRGYDGAGLHAISHFVRPMNCIIKDWLYCVQLPLSLVHWPQLLLWC